MITMESKTQLLHRVFTFVCLKCSHYTEQSTKKWMRLLKGTNAITVDRNCYTRSSCWNPNYLEMKMFTSGKWAIKAIPLLVLTLLATTSFSQDLTITSVVLKGEDVLINFDLNDDDLDHKYNLSLYSSTDNYVQPLKEVEGDVGVDLTVGGNKQIIWHAKKELGDDFKGNVALEVKGKLYIPFVTLNNFDDINSMKRGRPYNVTWAAGRGSNVLTFDLYNKQNELVHTFTNIANVGEYELEIPKDVKPGSDYRIKITDQRNKEDVVFTPTFKIKRKVPLYVNIALAGLGGSTGYLLVSNLGGEGGGTSETPLLDDPILPFD